MADKRIYELDGIEVSLSSPDKVYFPRAGVTKGQLADYYVAVSDHILRHLRERPTVLKRYAGGIEAEPFYQKRVPAKRPEWLETCVLRFPSGREAEELVPVKAATLVWGTSLGNIDWNPHPVRRSDLDHPDELRIDLDPQPEAPWSRVREVTMMVGELLREHGLIGYPKTSGSRGMHVLVRIEQRWGFDEVRRAALAVAREVERRGDGLLATSKWWKEERPPGAVFLDYNQNAKDHTTCAAYSVRPVADARVSAPLTWDEVATVEPEDLRIDTMAARIKAVGDPSAAIDDAPGSLDRLLALADTDESDRGLPDAPWPPHHPKGEREPPRVQPSRAKRPSP
ncbi:MAG: DNA primase small subunit domain-containing protein [Baekduia sp.]